jgi:hypothetical protein
VQPPLPASRFPETPVTAPAHRKSLGVGSVDAAAATASGENGVRLRPHIRRGGFVEFDGGLSEFRNRFEHLSNIYAHGMPVSRDQLRTRTRAPSARLAVVLGHQLENSSCEYYAERLVMVGAARTSERSEIFSGENGLRGGFTEADIGQPSAVASDTTPSADAACGAAG